MRFLFKLAAGALLAVGGFVAGPALADRDHDEIHQLRQLRNAGQILSLETILANHRRRYPHGQLLEAKLEVEQSRHIYDLKLLGEDGVVREFEYDARTGELWHFEKK
ncbi:MAG: peptidase M4 [Candidatus Competibacteraceae bacterium]|nr:MAG: peptidase M4 [Candidatus Competibacteraceae bacterium]